MHILLFVFNIQKWFNLWKHQGQTNQECI